MFKHLDERVHAEVLDFPGVQPLPMEHFRSHPPPCLDRREANGLHGEALGKEG